MACKIEAAINKTNLDCGFYSFTYTQRNLQPLDTNFTKFYIETAPKSNTYQIYKGSSVSRHCFLNNGWHRVKLVLRSQYFDSTEVCENEFWDSVWAREPLQVKISTKTCSGADVKIKVSGSGGTPLGNSYRYTFYTGKFGSNQVIRNFGPDSNFLLKSTHLQNSKDFYVVIQDLNECKDSTAFEVDKDDIILPNSKTIFDFCESSLDSISLNPNDSGVYIQTWTYKNQVIDSAVNRIMPLGAGFYMIKRSKSQTCFLIDSIKVMHSQPFSVQLNKTFIDSCQGNIKLTSVFKPKSFYQWFQDFESIPGKNDSILYPQQTGRYHLVITDEGLCKRVSDSLLITVLPNPKLKNIIGSTNNLDTGIAFVYEVPFEKNLKYTWYLTNAVALGKIDTNKITIKFKQLGPALLVAQYSNEYNCITQSGFPLYVDGRTVGLNQTSKSSDILVYPNPAAEAIYIELKNYSQPEKYSVKVYSLLGQLVYQASSHDKQLKISLEGWPKGSFYFVEIKQENQQLLHVEKVWVD